MCFGGAPVGMEGVLGIGLAWRGWNGRVSSFLSSSIQLMLSKNGCSLILTQLPSRFIGSFCRSYRNGHINTINLISTIDLISTIELFLLFILMHFFTLTFYSYCY